ncbi:hypothetical protein GCM10020218_081540 [Dactylosporangium vinaceum]
MLAAPMIASTDRVRLPIRPDTPPSRGDDLLVLTDRGAGRAVLLDLRTQVQRSLTLESDETAVVAGARPLLVHAATGRVDRLAADGSVAATPVAQTGGRPGGWAVAAGALWLAEPATGAVLRIGDAGPATRVEHAFSSGHAPLLAGAGDTLAVLDPEAGAVRLISGPAPGTYAVRLPGGRPASFGVAPGGDFAAFVGPATGGPAGGTARGAVGDRVSVTVAGLGDHAESVTRSVGAAGDSFGPPVLTHDRVYLGDTRSGDVWTIRARPAVGAPSSIAVAPGPADLELFVNGSAVWANDPNGPNAVAIYDDSRQPITKYAPPSASPLPSGPPPSPTAIHSSNPPTTSPTKTQTPSSRSPKATRTTGAGHPTNAPPGTNGPPGTIGPPAHANTAAFTNIGDGGQVGRCRTLAGRADIDATKTLMIAQKRTDPPDGTYYVQYAGPREGNLAPGRWTSTSPTYFGDQPGQHYSAYLLIVDVAAARSWWAAHESGDFAHATSLPGTTADTVTGLVRIDKPC